MSQHNITCPKEGRMIPLDTCITCKYLRREDDVSNMWCRWRIGRKEEVPKERELLIALASQLARKEESMVRAKRYKKYAEMKKIEIEMEDISYKIKRIEKTLEERR